jgi:DNA-directed RNA polymerase specialized sigma24 family protein
MAAKEYLEGFGAAMREIDIRLASLRRLRWQAETIPGVISISGQAREGSRVADYAVSLADEEAGILRDYNAAMALRQDIMETLAQLPAAARGVLELRYIAGKPWRDISDALGYEQRQLFRLHSRGISQVEAALALRQEMNEARI